MGAEENFKYDPSKPVNAEITVTEAGFLIYLNGEYFHFFKARLPFNEYFTEVKSKE